jgi:hypothetical protein
MIGAGEGRSRATNGLLVLAALGLLASGARPERASAQQAGGQQMFAVVAPGQGQGSNVLFVIDPATTRLLVYEHRVGGKLELVTVRNMEFETRFQQFPGEGPKAPIPPVDEIQKEVQKAGRAGG